MISLIFIDLVQSVKIRHNSDGYNAGLILDDVGIVLGQGLGKGLVIVSIQLSYLYFAPF